MKKFRKIVNWTGMVMLAFVLGLGLASLRQQSHNNALNSQEARLAAQKKLKRIKCGMNIDRNNLSLLLARKKASSKK